MRPVAKNGTTSNAYSPSNGIHAPTSSSKRAGARVVRATIARIRRQLAAATRAAAGSTTCGRVRPRPGQALRHDPAAPVPSSATLINR